MLWYGVLCVVYVYIVAFACLFILESTKVHVAEGSTLACRGVSCFPDEDFSLKIRFYFSGVGARLSKLGFVLANQLFLL